MESSPETSLQKARSATRATALVPKMCVEQDLEQGLLKEVRMEELTVERKVRLIFPARRPLSHAAQAFLEIVKGPEGTR